MANIYDVEGIEEFLPEQKKPLSIPSNQQKPINSYSKVIEN